MPYTKTGPICPYLLIAYHMVHSKELNDVSIALCGFSEAQNLVVYWFTNTLRWK
jgi:hypothetical protein